MAGLVVCLVLLQPAANLTTTALAFVLGVTLAAVFWGSGPALLGSVVALLSLNYFFIPPVHTWTIRDPENLVAFAVFLVVALTVGQLSSRAHHQAREAEARRQELEKLYDQLRNAFEAASEAESLRRSERLKTALLDAVTHDLRTPLTSIKASVTTVLQTPTGSISDEGIRELLLVINEESDRLDRFVEELMASARIEAGELGLRRSPVDVLEVINNAVDRAAPALRGRPLEIHVNGSPSPLLVDGSSVSEVIFELLENAADYSAAAKPIRVEARQDAETVTISVADEGIGVPPELREKVFDKFFRGPNGQRDKRGFGMGLSIARGIVEAHGGRIWIEPAPGRGTIVRFTVPCETTARHEPDTLPDLSRR
jgi:two-component system sensor histidine kinase KdpD